MNSKFASHVANLLKKADAYDDGYYAPPEGNSKNYLLDVSSIYDGDGSPSEQAKLMIEEMNKVISDIQANDPQDKKIIKNLQKLIRYANEVVEEDAYSHDWDMLISYMHASNESKSPWVKVTNDSHTKDFSDNDWNAIINAKPQ